MSSTLNKSIIDGIECLQSLAASDTAIGSRELSRQLDLQTMKVNRILRTLMSMGLAIQDEKKAYLPGPGIHVLAAQAMHGSSLMSRVLPVIENRLPAPHMIAVGVLWRDKVSYLVRAFPEESLSQSLIKNELYDAHKSSVGVVLLAQKRDDEIIEIIGEQKFNKIYDAITFTRQNGYLCQPSEREQFTSLAITLDSNSSSAIAFADLECKNSADIANWLEKLNALADEIRQAPKPE